MSDLSSMTDQELEQARFQTFITLALSEPPGPENVRRLRWLIEVFEEEKRATLADVREAEARQALGMEK